MRPGILVEEAEAPFSQFPNDVFVLRWLGLDFDLDLGAQWLLSSAKSFTKPVERKASAGLDRGRALSEMDEELMVMTQPFYTSKLNDVTTPPEPMLTKCFGTIPFMDLSSLNETY